MTAPFKEDAARTAGQGGALNTLRRRDGGWDGTNTDVEGFLAPLAGEALEGRRAAIVGAGGSARSVVSGLVSRGARVSVHARRPEAAQALADAAHVTAGPWPVPRGSWDLLVNTTPVGTHPDVDRSPVDAGRCSTARWSTTSSTTRGRRGCCATPRPPAAAPSTASTCSSRRPSASSLWWTGVTPEARVLREAAEGRLAAMAGPSEGTARTEAGTSV